MALDEAGMNSHTSVQLTVARGIGGILAVLTPVGIVGLFVTTMLGFEEPNTPMLFLPGVIALAAPITILVHLGLTRGLRRRQAAHSHDAPARSCADSSPLRTGSGVRSGSGGKPFSVGRPRTYPAERLSDSYASVAVVRRPERRLLS